MNDRQLHRHSLLMLAVIVGLAGFLFHDGIPVTAQTTGPTMLHPNLSVRAVVTGLTQPTTMAFIGENDLLVLEKGTGRVQRVVNGAIDSTVLDLAVNSGSERGLLGVALHPDFPEQSRRLSLLDREHDRQRHQRPRRDTAARQPG